MKLSEAGDDKGTAAAVRLMRLPHVEQYAGAWVMQAEVLDALAQRVRGMDIVAHVAATRAGFGDGLEMSTDAPVTITADGVAVLEINGTLTKYGSSLSEGPAMVAVQKQVRDLKKDSKVQGVMVQIDSGGGTVAGTEDLAAELRALAAVKPAMSRIVDTGASGAYWLALALPVISANRTAVIGSIGVMGRMNAGQRDQRCG